jgi:hypothetical protein
MTPRRIVASFGQEIERESRYVRRRDITSGKNKTPPAPLTVLEASLSSAIHLDFSF